MSVNEIHVGDCTVFKPTIYDGSSVVDISSATTTSLLLFFKKPGGSVTTQTASFVTTGSDGALKFTASASLLDSDGLWQLQAKVTLGTTTSVFYSDVYKFQVYPNLA